MNVERDQNLAAFQLLDIYKQAFLQGKGFGGGQSCYSLFLRICSFLFDPRTLNVLILWTVHLSLRLYDDNGLIYKHFYTLYSKEN